MEGKTHKNKPILLIGGVVLALAVVVGLYFGIRALTSNPENPEESNPVSETKDQDELDIEAAQAKSVYTEDGITTEYDRLDQTVASCAGYSINNRDAQIFYAMQFYGFMNNYSDVAPYFGLDVSKNLAEQPSTVDGLSWEQYFLMSAMDDFHLYAALATKAAAEGFVLSEADQQQLVATRDGIKNSYAKLGFDSVDAYIQADFGTSVRYEDFERYMEFSTTALAYQNTLYQQISFSDDELNDYYTEHPENFEGIDQNQISINVRHILVALNTAEGASEAEVNAAKAAAKAKAEKLLAEYNANPSETAFADLAKQNSEDPGSKENGGLYENVLPGQMVETFNDWCFDASRKPGDTGIVETEYGYHVMYFVSKSDSPYWMSVASDALRYDAMFDLLEEILAEYPMTTNYDDVFLCPLPKQEIG